MLKTNSIILSLATAIACVNSSLAQDCYQCNNSQFGYPMNANQGVHGGAIANNHQARKEKWEAWKVESAKITARNDAWPKPFACQDRMAHFQIWNTMITQGYAHHCILCEEHFQSETNQLNQAGKMKIASIMQNFPADRRHLFVVRDHNQGISQSRLENVNQVVQTFYGQAAQHTVISLTDRQPAMISGAQADAVVKGHLEGMPAPNIPVVTIGQGVAGANQ